MLLIKGYCEYCHRGNCSENTNHKAGCPEVEVYTLKQMLEDVIASGVTLNYCSLPYCRFCSAKGHWTDSGPVIPQHTDDCIAVKYAKYLEEWA